MTLQFREVLWETKVTKVLLLWTGFARKVNYIGEDVDLRVGLFVTIFVVTGSLALQWWHHLHRRFAGNLVCLTDTASQDEVVSFVFLTSLVFADVLNFYFLPFASSLCVQERRHFLLETQQPKSWGDSFLRSSSNCRLVSLTASIVLWRFFFLRTVSSPTFSLNVSLSP